MTTYYVDSTTGLDTDSGLTEALAKKTIGAAISISLNGDTIYVKNSAVYSEAVVIPVNTGRLLIGYASIISDKGRFILDGGSTLGVGITMSNSTGASILNKLKLCNIEIKNFTSHGTNYNRTGGDFNNAPQYTNLWSHNNGGNGFTSNRVGGSSIYYRCKANNNAGIGFDNVFGAIKCVSYSNAGGGFSILIGSNMNSMVAYCIAYANTGYGFLGVLNALHCIAYNNTLSGISIAGVSWAGTSINGNISTNNGQWGYTGGSANAVLGNGNLSFLNTSGDSNMPSSAAGMYGASVVNQDPGFTDAPNADFTSSSSAFAMAVGLEDEAVNTTNQHAGFFDPAGGGGAVTTAHFG